LPISRHGESRNREKIYENAFHKLYDSFAIATALFSFDDFDDFNDAHSAPFQRIRVTHATRDRKIC